jgi:xanthine/uracil permease
MKKARRPGRLPRWQEWSVYVTLGALIATGIAWLVLDWFVRVNGEFGPEHHPAEHMALIVHGVAAYAFLIIGGAMIPVHITLGWNTRRNLKSGLTLAGTCLLLAVTALCLYYLGDEISRNWVSIVHWMVGLIVIPALLIHALIGRSGR